MGDINIVADSCGSVRAALYLHEMANIRRTMEGLFIREKFSD